MQTLQVAHSAMPENSEEHFHDLEDSLDILFDERDALVLQLRIANGRIDTVRKELETRLEEQKVKNDEGLENVRSLIAKISRKVNEGMVERQESMENVMRLLTTLDRKVDKNMNDVYRMLRMIKPEPPDSLVAMSDLTSYIADSKRHDEQIKTHKNRLDEIEKCLQTQAGITSMHDRRLDLQTTRIQEFETKSDSQIKGLEQQHNQCRTANADALTQARTMQTYTQCRIGDLKQRNEKLEGLVRALTGQYQQTNGTLAPAQLLPVQTTNGQSLSLSVPKGSSLPPFKKHLSAVHDFIPGKQWMS